MSKKKKSHYVDSGMKVVVVGETITFNKEGKKHRIGSEWFYLNDISWYKVADGRIVAPVAGVVTFCGRFYSNSNIDIPGPGVRYMFVDDAEGCIVDVMPFGKCYEKSSLESLWDSLNGHGVSPSESEKSSENEAEFVNCQKFSEVSDEAKSDEDENV